MATKHLKSSCGFVSLEAGLILTLLIPLISAGVLAASYVMFLQDLDTTLGSQINSADLRMYGSNTGDQGFTLSNIGQPSLGDDGGTATYVTPPQDDNTLSAESIELRDSFHQLSRRVFQAFKSKIDPWCSNSNCAQDSYEVAVRIGTIGVDEKYGNFDNETLTSANFQMSAHDYFGVLESPHPAGTPDKLFAQILNILNLHNNPSMAIHSPIMGSTTTQYFGNYRSYSFMSPASINAGNANNNDRHYMHSFGVLGARAYVDITKTRLGDFLSIFPPICRSLGGTYDSNSARCTRILVGSSKITFSRLML